MTTTDPNHSRPTSAATEGEPDASHRARRSVVGPAAAVLVGVALALVAQFPLDSFAETSDAAHWFQHALLFWTGIVVGLGLYGLYRGAQDRP